MRELLKSMIRFAWAMPLFGANNIRSLIVSPGEGQGTTRIATALNSVTEAAQQQMGEALKAVFHGGDRLQSEVLEAMFGLFQESKPEHQGMQMHSTDSQSGHPNRHSAAERVDLTGPKSDTGTHKMDLPTSFRTQLNNTTQGPFWPPSEVMDKDGNFIVVGGFILKEVAAGKIAPVPNEKGVIVSKDTLPPLKDGKEDFSNVFGAPYEIVRELDLSPGGKDWHLRLYSLSCGPFVGHFGGGQPRIPRQGLSRYNLNANPRWNKWIAPTGSDSPNYGRPSYPLERVPIWRLDDIPEDIPIGFAVDHNGSNAQSMAEATGLRRRQPITLREFLQARGELKITLAGLSEKPRGFTHARFDFVFQKMLPNSIYAIWALRGVTLLPPTDPHFLLPVPLAIPNVVITDSRGDAAVSFLIRNPFPDPAIDPRGNRVLALAVTYKSDFQNWGAALTAIGTGADAHTAMAANLSALAGLVTVEPTGEDKGNPQESLKGLRV